MGRVAASSQVRVLQKRPPTDRSREPVGWHWETSWVSSLGLLCCSLCLCDCFSLLFMFKQVSGVAAEWGGGGLWPPLPCKAWRPSSSWHFVLDQQRCCVGVGGRDWHGSAPLCFLVSPQPARPLPVLLVTSSDLGHTRCFPLITFPLRRALLTQGCGREASPSLARGCSLCVGLGWREKRKRSILGLSPPYPSGWSISFYHFFFFLEV